jgi:hypothetical protein
MPYTLQTQCLCMIGNMLTDKGGDEVIAVVIALLHTQTQWYQRTMYTGDARIYSGI